MIGGVLALLNQGTLAATLPQTIRRTESGIFMGAGQNFQQYTESLNGMWLDSETGSLSAYTLGLMGVGRHDASLYWTIRYTATQGLGPYRGSVDMGLARNATTANNAWSLRARLGCVIDGAWGHGAATTFVPYLSLGFHRWHRRTHQALLPWHQVTYSNGRIGVGLLMAYALARRWVITFQALAGYTIAARLTGDEILLLNTTSGTLQSALVTETLGNRRYSALGGTITYLVERHWRVALRVRHAQWAFGSPAAVFVSTQAGRSLIPSRAPAGRFAETLFTLELSHTF